MNTKQAREYCKEADLFEKYIYDITTKGCKYVFTDIESEEMKTALEAFGEGVNPDTVLGLYSRNRGKEGILFTTDGIVSHMSSYEAGSKMYFIFDDEDDDEKVAFDYNYSFLYSDVKEVERYSYHEKRFRKTPDFMYAILIILKDGKEINLDCVLFECFDLMGYILMMAEPEEEEET